MKSDAARECNRAYYARRYRLEGAFRKSEAKRKAAWLAANRAKHAARMKRWRDEKALTAEITELIEETLKSLSVPELLAALKEAAAFLDDGQDDNPMIDRMRAAISKAEGRPQ